MKLRFRSLGLATLVLILPGGVTTLHAQEWEQQPLTTSGFGGTFGGNWIFRCPHCRKPFVLPTRHKAEAENWAYKSHVPACNPKAAGGGAGAAGGGPAQNLQELGVEAIAKGIVHNNSQLVAHGTAAIAADLFFNMLFSAPSGPSPQDVARQRLRDSERLHRNLNAKEDSAFLQSELLGYAARLRRDSELGDAERTERLQGAFDVVPRRSTAFFGSGAGASEEEIAVALAEDTDVWGIHFDGRGRESQQNFESGLRTALPSPQGIDSSTVILGGDPADLTISADFLEQSRKRALETPAIRVDSREFDRKQRDIAMATAAVNEPEAFGELENIRQVSLYHVGVLSKKDYGTASYGMDGALRSNEYLGNFGPDKGFAEFGPTYLSGQIAAIHDAKGALGNYEGPFGKNLIIGPYDTVGQLRAAASAVPYYLKYKMYKMEKEFHGILLGTGE